MSRTRNVKTLLQPDLEVTSFRQLDPVRLKKSGIRLLICDIDNTLVAYDDPDSNQDVEAFLRAVKEAGIHTALMSNNFSWRVERFARGLGLEKVYAFAMKPMPFSYLRACRDFGLKPQQAAILGDQLFTDTLGGNLAGVHTILSHPLVNRELFDTRILRKLERLAGRDLPRTLHQDDQPKPDWKPMEGKGHNNTKLEHDDPAGQKNPSAGE